MARLQSGRAIGACPFQIDERPDLRRVFPGYNYMCPDVRYAGRLRYDNNVALVGLQQQTFQYYWSHRAFDETGRMGLNIGAARMGLRRCWSLDVRRYPILDVVADATALPFHASTFGCVLASHVLEHIRQDMATVLRGWLSFVVMGGYVALVLPDQRWGDVLAMDPEHQHAPDSRTFRQTTLTHLNCEILEYDTLNNRHSFNVVLRRWS